MSKDREQRIARRFAKVASDRQYRDITEARTGRLASDGTVDTNLGNGLPAGQIWVRRGADGTRGEVPAIANISSAYADAPVLLGVNQRGELVAFDVNATNTQALNLDPSHPCPLWWKDSAGLISVVRAVPCSSKTKSGWRSMRGLPDLSCGLPLASGPL